MKDNKILLNGNWLIDYISNEPYKKETEPEFYAGGSAETEESTVTRCVVPAYFEDMIEVFRKTPLHAKLSWNPLYTHQRYPQGGYCPDMALPNPVGCFMYQRKFEVLENDLSCDAELYVGGVQNALSAWINGKYIGRHEGYSTEFFIKIPHGVLVAGENRITLAVSNNRLSGYMGRPVSGLTSRAANECTGGIWGDVEIRFLPDGIRDFWISVDEKTESFTVNLIGGNTCWEVSVYDGERHIYSAQVENGTSTHTVSCENYKKWSPSSPYLYTIKIYTQNQSFERKFGIRRMTVSGTRLYLNGEPYYFRGTCEHCYHPITVHPTREKSYYRSVVKTLKELGFNSIRFHTYVPMPEYMEAADEVGMVIEVETPNNTTYAEWQEIVNKCRQYTSVCAFSSGNEMIIDENYIEHLRAVAKYVHAQSDALVSPMSAMRGIEYYDYGDCCQEIPFPHNPKRLAALSEFCDIYNSYSLALTSYSSSEGSAKLLDERCSIYKKPILSHEICIHGTYIDLSIKDRYRGTRIGNTDFMSSVEEHLSDVGLLDKANLYYRNSVKWQMMLRKHCFETVRLSDTIAGYDFLGDIDTHWHTFGYCVGMMNEFYELKAGESVRNVLTYNSDTVLLCDLPNLRNYTAGESIILPILVSNYGKRIEKATLNLRVKADGMTVLRREIRISDIENGKISELYKLKFTLPRVETPVKITVSATLWGGNTDAENEWEIFAYPKVKKTRRASVTVADNMDLKSLEARMRIGESVVLFGTGPFKTSDTKFQLSVAGRTNGHLATVIADHPLMRDFAHDGYCGWQFYNMLNSKAAILDITRIPHSPIIDIASSYKNAHREAMLFEYRVGNGRLLVCTLNLTEADPAAKWLRERIISYASSNEFSPRDAITPDELRDICGNGENIGGSNENLAQNKNDITMNLV